MQSADAIEALTPVVTELERLGVRYYLCGSVASAFYGVSRSTMDVDLVAELAPRHVAPLVQALEGRYYVDAKMILDAIARKSCFNVIYLPANFKVDIFVAKTRPYDRAAMTRIREDAFDEAPGLPRVFLPSPEDVVLSKLEWFRLGDEVSQRQWDDVLKVMKVGSRSLDRSYMETWASELGVADLLARAWKEVEGQ